jgi:glutamyl-Q tRNA(Asp) synthetase
MIVTRFAPSPTGFLHLGHAFSALSAQAYASGTDDRLILRIEDIDKGRCKPEFVDTLMEDLDWLELNFSGPVWFQSQRIAVYAAALETLMARNLVYRCFRTRAEIARASASAPHSPETATSFGPHNQKEEAALLAEGKPFAWRLHAETVAQTTGLPLLMAGNFVLARKDFPASYHLASVLDDAAQGVTDIVRGTDLAEAEPIHRTLQALFGLPTPRYHHHPLILDRQGKRFAKRDGAVTLRELRARGIASAHIRGAFAEGADAFQDFARSITP